MRAEILGVGTELLLGQIANTNAQWISERLAEIGVDVHRHVVVGDNAVRIEEALRTAADRAEAVIVTGGLGPTADDITRDCLARVLGVGLRRDPVIESAMRERFSELGREMPASNLVQADVPEGARWIPARRGTAPGLVATLGDATVYLLPGVPTEMRDMMENDVLPELAARAGAGALVSRVIRSTGIPESRVGELLLDLFESSQQPTLAYLAGGGEVRVRLTARGVDRAEAERHIDPVATEVVRRLGDHVISDRGQELEAVILDLLRGRGWTLACAESLTGGELGGRITSIPGSSDVFLGSAVCYAGTAKQRILGVRDETLDHDGPVSRACVAEMARGARDLYGADVAIALTGVAGPEPVGEVAPGTVWIGLCGPDREHQRTLRTPEGRLAARRWATQHGLDLLRRYLRGLDLPESPNPAA